MVRTYKEDNILGYRVKYVDEGHGMIFAQAPSITTQYIGFGKKTEAKKAATKSLKQYIANEGGRR